MVFGHSGADRTEFTQNKQQVVDFSHAISKDIRRTICGATGISAGDAIASIGALGSEAVFKCTHNAPTTMAARTCRQPWHSSGTPSAGFISSAPSRISQASDVPSPSQSASDSHSSGMLLVLQSLDVPSATTPTTTVRVPISMTAAESTWEIC
jgi:hypothetical protein